MPADPTKDLALHLMPDTAKRQLCLDLLEAAGAVAIRVNDATGEIVHGCLLTPGAHRDQSTNPTASLNYKRLAGNCLGCKAAGGIAWFAATVLRMDAAGVRAWLAERGPAEDGLLPLGILMAAIAEAFQGTSQTREPLPVYSASALNPYRHAHGYWTDPPAPPGTQGGGRGVHPSTVARFQLGYDPDSGRVAIPHRWNGQLVGWQTRSVRHDGGPRKYENTPCFPRNSTLFAYNPDAEELVWVEAAMSVLRHAHAMDDVTSSFGAHVSDEQIRIMVSRAGRPLRRILLWPDADRPGWDAIDGGPSGPEHGLIARLSPHVPVWIVDSPFTDDPAVLDTDTAWAIRRRYAVPAALWRRPELLACWHCRRPEHPGSCQTLRLAA